MEIQTATDNHRLYRKIFLFYLATLVLIDILAYQQMIPTELKKIPYYDTICHFLLLGIAAFLLHRACQRHCTQVLFLSLPSGPFVLAVLATTDEFIQYFSPVRSFSFLDMLANLSGICFFTYLAHNKSKKQ